MMRGLVAVGVSFVYVLGYDVYECLFPILLIQARLSAPHEQVGRGVDRYHRLTAVWKRRSSCRRIKMPSSGILPTTCHCPATGW